MVHSQLISYFNFLGLEGFAKQQEYQYLEENKNYLNFCQYYTLHYNRLIKDERIDDPMVLPESWFNKERSEIDSKNISNLVARGFKQWVEWEKNTKELFSKASKNLFEMGEISSFIFINKIIEAVDKELAQAEAEKLLFESTYYDMSYIADIQKDLVKKYSKKVDN